MFCKKRDNSPLGAPLYAIWKSKKFYFFAFSKDRGFRLLHSSMNFIPGSIVRT